MAKDGKITDILSVPLDEEGLIKSNDETIRSVIDNMCPENVQRIRDFVCVFDPNNIKTTYSDAMVAQAYIAARASKTGSLSMIAKNLGISYSEFSYYMDTYSEFAAAVRMGMLDGKEIAKERLTSVLYQRAVGMTVTETKHEDSESESGTGIISTSKTTKTEKVLPPDINAALAILRKLDPSWSPAQKLEIKSDTTYTNYNVTADVSMDLDLKKLSPEALREILNTSNQQIPHEYTLNQNEEGVTAITKDIKPHTKHVMTDEERAERSRKIKEGKKAAKERKEQARQAEIKQLNETKRQIRKSVKGEINGNKIN